MSTDVTCYVTCRNTLCNTLRNTRNSCYARREFLNVTCYTPYGGV